LEELPLVIHVDEMAKLGACSNCFREVNVANKCATCEQVAFCSQECKDAADSSSHTLVECEALKHSLLGATNWADEDQSVLRMVIKCLLLRTQNPPGWAAFQALASPWDDELLAVEELEQIELQSRIFGALPKALDGREVLESEVLPAPSAKLSKAMLGRCRPGQRARRMCR
jgi:hypothetical protein